MATTSTKGRTGTLCGLLVRHFTNCQAFRNRHARFTVTDMTVGAVVPLVVLVHGHAPMLRSLALALTEAGALSAKVRTLSVSTPQDADEAWVLQQCKQLLELAHASTTPPILAVDEDRWEV